MLDIIIEFLIVFEDKILGKKRSSKTDKRISFTTIIILVVFIALLITMIIKFFPLLNEE